MALTTPVVGPNFGRFTLRSPKLDATGSIPVSRSIFQIKLSTSGQHCSIMDSR